MTRSIRVSSGLKHAVMHPQELKRNPESRSNASVTCGEPVEKAGSENRSLWNLPFSSRGSPLIVAIRSIDALFDDASILATLVQTLYRSDRMIADERLLANHRRLRESDKRK